MQPQQYVSRQVYRTTNVLNGTFFFNKNCVRLFQVSISFVKPKVSPNIRFLCRWRCADNFLLSDWMDYVHAQSRSGSGFGPKKRES